MLFTTSRARFAIAGNTFISIETFARPIFADAFSTAVIRAAFLATIYSRISRTADALSTLALTVPRALLIKRLLASWARRSITVIATPFWITGTYRSRWGIGTRTVIAAILRTIRYRTIHSLPVLVAFTASTCFVAFAVATALVWACFFVAFFTRKANIAATFPFFEITFAMDATTADAYLLGTVRILVAIGTLAGP